MAASHSTLQDWRLDISHLNHPYLPPAIRVCVPARYCVGSPLGAGAFGVVCSGTHLVSGGEVAIKQIRDPFEHPKQAKCFLREIVYQSRLDHPNVLRIKDLWLGLDGALYVCTDRMETDLGWVIKSPQPLTRDHVVYFIYQITLALKYLHAANIVHRDLKPGNCLVSGNCDLKICDFGMCRVIDQEPEQPEPLSEYVVTRWYRAPEIILCTQYDQSVDLWSLGCIMAQLIQRKPLFKGDSSRAQISAITDVTGVPANFLETVQMPDGARRFLQRTHNEHPTPPEVHWEDHIEVAQSYGAHLDPSASAALSATLQLDPSKRVSASHFLGLPFLAQLHDAESELVPDKPLCSKWEKHVDYSDPSGPRTVVEMEMERLNPKTPETVRRRVVTLNEIEDALYTKGDLLPEPAGDALDPMELA